MRVRKRESAGWRETGERKRERKKEHQGEMDRQTE